MGKRYNISPLRLLQKYSSTNSVEHLDSSKTFFCSELVAAAYKSMGLLPSDICCAQYWPGSFSTDQALNLLHGAVLGREKLLEFLPQPT